MRTHIERMKDEHEELKQRVEDLNAFIYGNKIFKGIDDLEQARMIKQVGFMEAYLSTIECRIWVAVTYD